LLGKSQFDARRGLKSTPPVENKRLNGTAEAAPLQGESWTTSTAKRYSIAAQSRRGERPITRTFSYSKDDATYSVRNAFMGSTEAARRAGRTAANNATSAIKSVPTTSVTGSNELIP
jgi:hypothetical protein